MNFYQIRFINECARKIKAKSRNLTLPEFQSFCEMQKNLEYITIYYIEYVTIVKIEVTKAY